MHTDSDKQEVNNTEDTAERLTTKELMKMTAKSSKYHLYEVEDVVGHMLKHLQTLVAEGKHVHLKGIGTVSRVVRKPLRILDVRSKQIKIVPNVNKVSVRMDEPMREAMRKNPIQPEGTYEPNEQPSRKDSSEV